MIDGAAATDSVIGLAPLRRGFSLRWPAVYRHAMLTWLKWFGTGMGIAGALVIALNLPFSGWGFVLFLVSSVSRTVADTGSGGHSVFAKALLDVPHGNATLIDGTDLFAKVRQQVRLNAGQTPQYQNIRMAGHEVGGDFLFVRRQATELKRKQVAVVAPPKPKPKAPSPVKPAAKKAGQVFRDCADCPEMVVIPAGSFRMGYLSGWWRYGDEKPVHRVTIPRPFAVGKYEVTQAEWGEVMGSNPSSFKGDHNPVERVSWNDVKDFVRRLGTKTGKRYRLLTEAEWEYAARAGTTTPFHFGATISTDQANYDGNYTYGGGRKGVYRKKTVPVGSFPANAFGLS